MRPIIRCILATAALAAPAIAHAAETITYNYDARGRLVQVARAGNVNDGVITSYAYDKAHNRTSKSTTIGLFVVPLGGLKLILRSG